MKFHNDPEGTLIINDKCSFLFLSKIRFAFQNKQEIFEKAKVLN